MKQMNARNGIIGGGNLIYDNIKLINYYPNKNMMCNIKEVANAIGGCPHNVLIDLAKMKVDKLPLTALGLVGSDKEGELIVEDFKLNNVDTQYIQISNTKTSFTDVMIEISTGHRTFFHFEGANAELDVTHFVKCAEESNAKIFHLANLLHLDKLDSPDEEFGLISARVLSMLVEKGFKTSVDLVSVKSPLFQTIADCCLKYIDYLIINEIEAQSLSNLIIRTGDSFDMENLITTGRLLIDKGVRLLVVIHLPEGGFAMDTNKSHWFIKAYHEEKVKSAVGAGDAFCAGMLYSLHENLEITNALKIANANARFNLFHATATGGAVSLETVMQFINSK